MKNKHKKLIIGTLIPVTLIGGMLFMPKKEVRSYKLAAIEKSESNEHIYGAQKGDSEHPWVYMLEKDVSNGYPYHWSDSSSRNLIYSNVKFSSAINATLAYNTIKGTNYSPRETYLWYQWIKQDDSQEELKSPILDKKYWTKCSYAR